MGIAYALALKMVYNHGQESVKPRETHRELNGCIVIPDGGESGRAGPCRTQPRRSLCAGRGRGRQRGEPSGQSGQSGRSSWCRGRVEGEGIQVLMEEENDEVGRSRKPLFRLFPARDAA